MALKQAAKNVLRRSPVALCRYTLGGLSIERPAPTIDRRLRGRRQIIRSSFAGFNHRRKREGDSDFSTHIFLWTYGGCPAQADHGSSCYLFRSIHFAEQTWLSPPVKERYRALLRGKTSAVKIAS